MLLHQVHKSFAVCYKVNLNGNIILSISNIISIFIANKKNSKEKQN